MPIRLDCKSHAVGIGCFQLLPNLTCCRGTSILVCRLSSTVIACKLFPCLLQKRLLELYDERKIDKEDMSSHVMDALKGVLAFSPCACVDMHCQQGCLHVVLQMMLAWIHMAT